jgi:hypothetical protein
MAIIYSKWPFQGSPKFTEIWIFCLKINHLATLLTISIPEFFSRATLSFCGP